MKNLLLSRRQILRAGSGAALGASLSRLLEREASAAARGKAIIVLWMNGGPSHVDTWDPKPGTAVAGPHKAIRTKTPGLLVSEHLPRLAELSHKFAVVRGMTSKEGNHQRAQYLLRTGYAPNPTVQHPSLGGWVSRKLGDDKSGMPAFVSIGGPSLGAGFLGVQYGPFVLPKGGAKPQNLGYSGDVDEERFDARRDLLEAMEARFESRTGDPKVTGRRALYDKAIRLMHTSELRAFDLDEEPEPVRKAFGDTDFGRGCLEAVRLVQAGVKIVEVVLDGWDTHTDNFGRTKRLMGALDPAMSALLLELDKRGLGSQTVVLWAGDFGRTPKINGNEGRDHYPQAFSAVLAGGGVRGGVVVGETDARGEKVVKDPTSVPDLMATVTKLLGLDPHESFLTPIGRPIAVTDNGTPVSAITSGG